MTNKYTGDVNTAVAAAAVSHATLGGDLIDMNKTGWLLAGAYYYEIASWGNQVQHSGMPLLNVVLPSLVNMGGYRNDFTTGDDLVKQIDNSSGSNIATANPGIADATSKLNGAAQGIVNNFTSEISGSTGFRRIAVNFRPGTLSHHPDSGWYCAYSCPS
jgi:hypothetical protein